MRKTDLLLMTAAALLIASGAQASELYGAITADNEFNAYISTSDSTLGTLVAHGADWTSAQSFSVDLAQGQTYYLHVVANNFFGPGNMAGGNPDALLGSFVLFDTSHSFANGQQSLDTDTTNWRVSPGETVQDLNGPIAWTQPTDAPISFATNGGGIWGSALGRPVNDIWSQADWIWSQTDPSGEAFFSTTISANGGVPEPASWALMIVGFGLAGAALRRRKLVAA
jgi:hypothetical protein